MGALFSALYPGQHFDPLTSPNRTYLVIKRLRKWFVESSVPLEVESHNESFKLISTAPYIIRVSFQNINVSKNDSVLESLVHQISDKPFTIDLMSESLGMTKTACRRFVAWAIAKNKLRRIQGPKCIQFKLRVKHDL